MKNRTYYWHARAADLTTDYDEEKNYQPWRVARRVTEITGDTKTQARTFFLNAFPFDTSREKFIDVTAERDWVATRQWDYDVSVTQMFASSRAIRRVLVLIASAAPRHDVSVREVIGRWQGSSAAITLQMWRLFCIPT